MEAPSSFTRKGLGDQVAPPSVERLKKTSAWAVAVQLDQATKTRAESVGSVAIDGIATSIQKLAPGSGLGHRTRPLPAATAAENVTPPSVDLRTGSRSPLLQSNHVTKRLPSFATAGTAPVRHPVARDAGADQLAPPSVERENMTSRPTSFVPYS